MYLTASGGPQALSGHNYPTVFSHAATPSFYFFGGQVDRGTEPTFPATLGASEAFQAVPGLGTVELASL